MKLIYSTCMGVEPLVDQSATTIATCFWWSRSWSIQGWNN